MSVVKTQIRIRNTRRRTLEGNTCYTRTEVTHTKHIGLLVHRQHYKRRILTPPLNSTFGIPNTHYVTQKAVLRPTVCNTMRTLTSLMFLLCALLLSTTALGNKLPRLPPGVEYGSEYYKPGEGRTSQLGADHWVSHMFADEEDKVGGEAGGRMRIGVSVPYIHCMYSFCNAFYTHCALYTQPKYYVDCGAHNPKFISNSYQLDQLGWRGICIEPNPSGDFAERTCTLERRAVDDVAGMYLVSGVALVLFSFFCACVFCMCVCVLCVCRGSD